MNRRKKINTLKRYKDALKYLKRFEEKEEIKTNQKQKILVKH